MGSLYLVDLADVMRSTGWPVIEVDGWQSRARSSGGYSGSNPSHLMVHHTASPPSADGWPDVQYCTFNDEDAPLCNLYLSRDGTWYICAAGATNCNGSGHDPCGMVADDSMNSAAVAVEAGNDGTGERWPDRQLDSYTAGCSALGPAYGIPTGRIHAHFEYAPTRKTDPAGPDRYAYGATPWDMAAFRADCDQGDDDMPTAREIADAIWATELPNYVTGSTSPASDLVAGCHYEAYAAAHPDPAKGPMVPNQVDGKLYDWPTMLSAAHYEAYEANHP